MNFTFLKRKKDLLPKYIISNQKLNVPRFGVRNCQICRIFHCFSKGPAAVLANFELLDFSQKQSAQELFNKIFENASPKGSLR